MSIELLVAINLMTLSAFAAAMLIARRDWTFASTIAIHLAILVVGALALWLRWPHPAWIVGVPFAVLVAAPGVLVTASTRRNARGDAEGAVKFLRWAATIQPTAPMRFQADFAAAQAVPSPDARAEAFRALAAKSSPRNATTAEIAAWQALDRWDEVLSAIDARTGRHEGDIKARAAKPLRPEWALMHLRALGEVGEVGKLVESYQKLRAELPANERETAELFLFAFTGREDALKALFTRKYSSYDDEAKRYWQAVAARNNNNDDDYPLLKLAQGARRETTRRAAIRLLASPTRDIRAELSAADNAFIDRISERTLHDSALRNRSPKHAIATFLLLIVNAVMFAMEAANGGVENLETLYNLGGMWPTSVDADGEWWRLGSALFLHFGLAHFSINMLSLYVLGRALEVRLGALRFLFVYLAGGLISSAGVLYLMHTGIIPEALLVGASGAIMAIFGGLMAWQVVNWRRSRDILDRRPIFVFLAIVALQTAIDMSLPQVSLSAHLTGFLAGFLLTLPIAALMPKRIPKPG